MRYGSASTAFTGFAPPPSQAFTTNVGPIKAATRTIGWHVAALARLRVAGVVCAHVAVFAPRKGVAGPSVGVAPVTGAWVAVGAEDPVVAGILTANVPLADARLPIPVAGLTPGAPAMVATVGKAKVMGAVIAVVARVLPADARKTDTIETT